MATYKAMLEQEKELIKNKATYDSLAEKKQQLETSVSQAEKSAEEIRQKKAALTLMKIGPLQQIIERAAELEKKHGEYILTSDRLKELAAYEPEWKELTAALAEAEEEKVRLDSGYGLKKAQLTGQISSLRRKVELLSDSGCPDIERATCKFLSDALAAKAELPGAEAELEALEKSYEDSRRENEERIAEAKKALADSPYKPEEVETLKSSLTVLEAAEKEYIALDGQRAELKLLEERRGEMDASIKNAEEVAAKGREELAAVEKQLSDAETYSREYESFQQELQKQSLWLEKEKQLPVAREQKAAASSRIMELTTEIESVETELSEAREELAAEQAKTVGKDELQAQVEAAEQTVKTLREHAQTAAMQLGGLKNAEAEAKKKLVEAAELQKRMNELGGKAAGYEELKKAFSQDGIPHNIIRSIIPIFEATATNILGQMSGGKMSVEFVTEKTLKSNSKKEVTTLDIIINDSDTGRLPYMSRSGGERVKAALSVILALSEIKSSKAGIQLGFLFIDEPPFLDAPGVQAYCDALEAIQRRYSDLKVMAITHDPAMKSRFPQSVDVVKTPEGSKVIYE